MMYSLVGRREQMHSNEGMKLYDQLVSHLIAEFYPFPYYYCNQYL
jgi:hypothetical protein